MGRPRKSAAPSAKGEGEPVNVGHHLRRAAEAHALIRTAMPGEPPAPSLDGSETVAPAKPKEPNT